jgi:hypothetical protein
MSIFSGMSQINNSGSKSLGSSSEEKLPIENYNLSEMDKSISKLVTEYLVSLLDPRTMQDFSASLLAQGVTLENIASDPEKVKAALENDFDASKDIIASIILASTYRALGIKYSFGTILCEELPEELIHLKEEALGNGWKPPIETTANKEIPSRSDQSNSKPDIVIKTQLEGAASRLRGQGPDGFANIIHFLTRDFFENYVKDRRMYDNIEYSLYTEHGTSLNDLDSQPDKVGKALHHLFGEGAEILADLLVRHYFISFGMPARSKTYRIADLGLALSYIKKLCFSHAETS